jgi:hypothetical protein
VNTNGYARLFGVSLAGEIASNTRSRFTNPMKVSAYRPSVAGLLVAGNHGAGGAREYWTRSENTWL